MPASAACTGRASPPTSNTTRRRRSRATCSPPWPAPSDVAAALDAYEPQTPGYLALKAKLAEIRAGKLDKDASAPIAGGPVLKIGMQDDRVPALRERLGVLGDGGTTYDKPLAEAVKKFQQEHQIAATGTLTAATIEAIERQGAGSSVEDIILANMERWRWMPHQFPATYVIVNLPDFTLRVMHDGKLVWTTKIVDGKPDMPTPIMTADMKYITINPTWNVPPSIINHEYLPALAQDPTVLDRMGLKIARQSRRHRAYLAAAGRQERARPHPLQFPQQVPGLPARHAGQISVRLRQARLQPRLHAGAGSAALRRGAAVAGAARTTATPKTASKR